MKRKRVLFIDRDGTLIREPADEQIDAFEKLEFLPGVFHYLGRIVRELDFELVMVTNQDGLGTEAFPEDTFWPVQQFMLRTLEAEGIHFSAVHIDRTFPEEGAPTRKPGTGLLGEYFGDGYDLEGSFVLGDRLTDMELAKNLGAKGIFINSHPELGAGEVATPSSDLQPVIAWEGQSWEGIYAFLKLGSREAEVHRKTAETEIDIRLNLDGSGKSQIRTGLAFFDHMLDQLARHGQMDLDIRVNGDLEVDEHHTIEDTAIALGDAFYQALGSKMGVERYGFTLPMDDCLAQVALDFGGRSWLVWEAEFKREKIGDMPTEMFLHFFKSFADSARANLNIKAEGQNEHHKIEAIFKAFAKAVKMAVKRDPDRMVLPSTKGIL
ncbi:bifunctional histidinol-phosphatase/imidazoleglycerol-phosphate dehydratase HisB [Robiginitalea sp. M366]|uniref:bifunctional histidinol-phosphatase/imidazoleglycerol-phosphate dehydratase HisB n=1 Tax=Robiginitalea aestuariiviva TaxID=3036903 RepID=UPI00240CE8D9|nr:bifunctional histidinol-phosphatase/imidazoleglycerol-phosphate dehydratase HisB [Robiginitalea aestuariiviva]MDG1572963.1 bifunctional histidinol-phosphatase/imidazoleglycerol-phosphate dehydratase HisB [Robiginitalea aestuariiviva]